MRERRTTRLAGGIAIVAIATGLAGQAGRISDRADVLNFFAPAWIGTGVLAGIVLLVAARKGMARLLGVTTIAVLGLMALTLRPADTHLVDCAGVGDDLTLVQFNVLKDNRDIGRAIAWIEGTHADLVTIEEAAGELPIVADLRSQYPYMVSCVAGLHCSTMILSRRPFVASGGLARGDPENRGGLSAAWATLPSPSGPFTVVAAHLDRPWPWHSGPDDVAMLTAFVRRQNSDTTLVAGDFNRPSWSFQLAQLTRALGLDRAADIRSWPATGFSPPLLAIDHVFFGRRWSVTRIERGPALGSDHYPLLVRLRSTPGICPGSDA